MIGMQYTFGYSKDNHYLNSSKNPDFDNAMCNNKEICDCEVESNVNVICGPRQLNKTIQDILSLVNTGNIFAIIPSPKLGE